MTLPPDCAFVEVAFWAVSGDNTEVLFDSASADEGEAGILVRGEDDAVGDSGIDIDGVGVCNGDADRDGVSVRNGDADRDGVGVRNGDADSDGDDDDDGVGREMLGVEFELESPSGEREGEGVGDSCSPLPCCW